MRAILASTPTFCSWTMSIDCSYSVHVKFVGIRLNSVSPQHSTHQMRSVGQVKWRVTVCLFGRRLNLLRSDLLKFCPLLTTDSVDYLTLRITSYQGGMGRAVGGIFTADCDTEIVFRLDALALSVIATATWLAGWVAGCLSQPVPGIVSKRLNVSENFFDHLIAPS